MSRGVDNHHATKLKFVISTCAFLQFPRQERNTDNFLSRIPPHEIVVLDTLIINCMGLPLYGGMAHGSKIYDI